LVKPAPLMQQQRERVMTEVKSVPRRRKPHDEEGNSATAHAKKWAAKDSKSKAQKRAPKETWYEKMPTFAADGSKTNKIIKCEIATSGNLYRTYIGREDKMGPAYIKSLTGQFKIRG